VVTDLTSIGTLFAFILVCVGVLYLPKKEKTPGDNSFHMPRINGRWIIPALFLIFIYGYSERIGNAFSKSNSGEEMMFLVFLIITVVKTIITFIKNLSLIPILGMLCCLYLMIEIPPKSWLVFFGWMSLGLLIYLGYGRKRSKLAEGGKQ